METPISGNRLLWAAQRVKWSGSQDLLRCVRMCLCAMPSSFCVRVIKRHRSPRLPPEAIHLDRWADFGVRYEHWPDVEPAGGEDVGFGVRDIYTSQKELEVAPILDRLKERKIKKNRQSRLRRPTKSAGWLSCKTPPKRSLRPSYPASLAAHWQPWSNSKD